MSASSLAPVLLAGLLIVPSATAQSSYDLLGSARADGLSNSTTALPASAGVQSNPASRVGVSRATALFYARQSFGLSALRYGASHVALPFDWGTPSLGISTFGFEEYREVHTGLGYARAFPFGTTRTVQIGAVLRYHHVSIPGYGHAGTVGANVGLIVPLLRSLHLGARATNLNGAVLAPRTPLPRTVALGACYRAAEGVLLLVDVFKDVRFPASVRSGLEVRPVSSLALRVGVTTVPRRFSVGAGLNVGPLTANLAAVQHRVLGWSPSASLQVQW